MTVSGGTESFLIHFSLYVATLVVMEWWDWGKVVLTANVAERPDSAIFYKDAERCFLLSCLEKVLGILALPESHTTSL